VLVTCQQGGMKYEFRLSPQFSVDRSLRMAQAYPPNS
jgi:hypothetical protein